MPTPADKTPGLTGTEWLICVIAAIGFAFDTYELLMLPLIVGPALRELMHAAPGTPAYADWVGLLFFVPAVFGGIFGLLGGYLTDRLGRRRVLTWSILVYAFSALAAGYAPASTGCSCSAARRSSACASSSSPRRPGWPSSSPTRSSASECSATRRRSARSAGCWSATPTTSA